MRGNQVTRKVVDPVPQITGRRPPRTRPHLRRDLSTIKLGDALRIAELMALDSDVCFSKAPARRAERYRAETGAGLPEVQLAAAALGRLWEEPDSEVALATLRALVER